MNTKIMNTKIGHGIVSLCTACGLAASLLVPQVAVALPTPPSYQRHFSVPAASSPKTHLHVNNHTRWKILIYLDGDYVGTVDPYGDSYGYVFSGQRRLFAVAKFKDAPDKTWGPRIVDLDDGGDFEWTLYD